QRRQVELLALRLVLAAVRDREVQRIVQREHPLAGRVAVPEDLVRPDRGGIPAGVPAVDREDVRPAEHAKLRLLDDPVYLLIGGALVSGRGTTGRHHGGHRKQGGGHASDDSRASADFGWRSYHVWR